MTTHVPCPCCGSPLDQRDHPEILLHSVTVGAQRLILRELINSYPNFVTKQKLISLIYGYGGSENADGTIETYICRLKIRISQSPFSIFNSRGVGYRLEKKEVPE